MINILKKHNYILGIGLLILLIVLTILILGAISALYDVNLCIEQITQKHLEIMKEEGYLSDDIKKSIINDIRDVGNFSDIRIYGPNKEVAEGEDICLSVEIANGYVNLVNTRMGMKKYRTN